MSREDWMFLMWTAGFALNAVLGGREIKKGNYGYGFLLCGASLWLLLAAHRLALKP